MLPSALTLEAKLSVLSEGNSAKTSVAPVLTSVQ